MGTEAVIAGATVAQVILTGVLAWVLNRSTNTIARLDFSRSVRESWIGIDELALANEATLEAADSLLVPRPAHERTGLSAHKRWFILAYLNPINTTYQGAIDGIFGSRKEEMLDSVRSQLQQLLVDHDAYWVSQNHGHDESFKALCTQIWEAHQPQLEQ
jgi:hypothetical protein